MKTKIAALALFACLFIGLAQGQPGSIIDRHPFLVNSDGGFSERNGIAADGDGNFTVVWDIVADANDPVGIWARRFAASGAPMGPQVHLVADDDPQPRTQPMSPDIAMTDAGNSVVAWWLWTQDNSPEHILFRRYNAAGVPLGAAVTLETGDWEPPFDWPGPQVVMDSSGNFLILWARTRAVNSYHAQLFRADGTPRGSPFLVSWDTGPAATVAMGPAGNFVVVWVKGPTLRGRLFNADGTHDGREFVVAKNPRTAELYFVRVAMDGSGNFVVAYANFSLGIFARRFDADGTALGKEFRVSKKGGYTHHQYLDLDMNSAGEFALSWQAGGNGAWPHTRLYAADGSAVTGARSLPPAPGGWTADGTALAMVADGGYVFVWGQGVPHIMGRRVAGPHDARPACSYYLATRVGTNAADTLTGTSGDDVIQAREGIDWVDGGGGDDILCGGGDGDQLYGGNGSDQLFGGPGDDVLDGGPGSDFCDGRVHDNADTALNCETVINVP